MLYILKNLTRTLTNLKYDMRTITTKIDRLENVITDQQKNQNNSSTKNDYYLVDESIYKFPLTSLEELNIFEEKIMDKDFRQKMVIMIQLKMNLSIYYYYYNSILEIHIII